MNEPGYFITDGPADVAAVIVTYNSADHLGRLLGSLRPEAVGMRLRVVVADNGSTDGTAELARAHQDVSVLETGGNLGYAGAINAAMPSVGAADSILILNPDLEVLPGAVSALHSRLTRTRAGMVVPGILDAEDARTFSLREEPTLWNALGDAAFGGRMRRRPSGLSETVFDPDAYARPHRIMWATGAALLIDAAAAEVVGEWDERFFLYSEETDYCRRMRDAGYEIWYEPAAAVRHDQGGSGTSLDLDRLLTVNRIRYARKHHRAVAAAAYRAVVILHELVRAGQPRHRAVLRTVARESSWVRLPRAEPAASVADEVRT